MSDTARSLNFRNDPSLAPYILEGFSETHRTLGSGTFGVTKELTSGGAFYVGKKLHDFILESQDEGSSIQITRLAQVCKLMSEIRHPNIIQFIGLYCFDDKSPSHPMLVVEQLDIDLDRFLKNPARTIPFSLKLNIYYDIVKGLFYLHDRKPLIVHRNLTARNILLNQSSMRAKITDYGCTLLCDSQRVTAMLCRIPNVAVYMPPEATEIQPEYKAPVDIFSFGQVMLYTALQEFPGKLLPISEIDPETNQLRLCSEVERRGPYFEKLNEKKERVYQTLSLIIKQCFQNQPDQRPTANELMTSIEDLKSEHEDPYAAISKIELVQLLESMKADTAVRRKSSDDEFKMEKAVQARITELQGGMPATMEILRQAGRRRPLVWKHCLFKIISRTGQLQYSELNSNKVLSRIKFKDIEDVKSVEMPRKLEDRYKFYFEIHFRRRNSRPWQLRVFSTEERDAWMEAIKPGSTMTNGLVKYKRSILAAFEQPIAEDTTRNTFNTNEETLQQTTSAQIVTEIKPNQNRALHSQALPLRKVATVRREIDQVEKMSDNHEDSDDADEYIDMSVTAGQVDNPLKLFYVGVPKTLESMYSESSAQAQPEQSRDSPPPLPARPSSTTPRLRLQSHLLNARERLQVSKTVHKIKSSQKKSSSDKNQTQSQLSMPPAIPESESESSVVTAVQEDKPPTDYPLLQVKTELQIHSPSRVEFRPRSASFSVTCTSNTYDLIGDPKTNDQTTPFNDTQNATDSRYTCTTVCDKKSKGTPHETQPPHTGEPLAACQQSLDSGNKPQLPSTSNTSAAANTLPLNKETKFPPSSDTDTDPETDTNANTNANTNTNTNTNMQDSNESKLLLARRAAKLSGRSRWPKKPPVPIPRRRSSSKTAAKSQQQMDSSTAASTLHSQADCQPYEHFSPVTEKLENLQKQTLFISPSCVEIHERIGQGQYGTVFKGTLSRGYDNTVLVAVKTSKKCTSEKDATDFKKEMNTMLTMIHPNIVRVYGLMQQDVFPSIVMEYLPHGNLKTFLMNNRRPVKVLIKYMLDVAIGMHYISEKGLVHRDLAARNIIVGENETCKVSDFGLLREISKDSNVYTSCQTTHLPIRWMAPESLREREFSTASDVWSYAVLLWEMHQPDRLPYAELTDSFHCCIKIIEGYRLRIPEPYPHIVKEIMEGCWLKDPLKRPSFFTISSLLTNVC